MTKVLPCVAAALLAAFTFTSCDTPGETALLGAAIGSVSGEHPLRNAGIGAAAGYVVGKLAQHERRRQGEDVDYYEDHGVRHRYPLGRPTRRPGLVESPWSGNLVDVRGIPSGAKVIDPSADRIFINP